MRLSALAVSLILLAPLLGGCGDDEVGSPGSWSRVEDAPESDGFAATTVWAFGDDNVWLGGKSCWQYNGSTWTERPIVIQGTTFEFVRKFWAFSPNDLWAIVDDEHVVRWDGTEWTELRNDITSLPFDDLSVIWGSAPDDMWIANENNSRVFHWDGTTWALEVLQFSQATALWGSGPNDVWLSGLTDAYRYDGSSWTEYDPGDGEEPRSVGDILGFGPNDVWAADGEVMRYDGNTWRFEEDLLRGYHHIWGTSSSDMFAVGNYQSIAHYDGSEWEEETDVLDVDQNFIMVHGSSSTNVWATALDFETGFFLMRRDR